MSTNIDPGCTMEVYTRKAAFQPLRANHRYLAHVVPNGPPEAAFWMEFRRIPDLLQFVDEMRPSEFGLHFAPGEDPRPLLESVDMLVGDDWQEGLDAARWIIQQAAIH